MAPRFQRIFDYSPVFQVRGAGKCGDLQRGPYTGWLNKPIHIWRTPATAVELWGIVDAIPGSCGPADVHMLTDNTTSFYISGCTVGDGLPLTLHEIAGILINTISPPPGIAIRWGCLFSTATIPQLTQSTLSLHFLGYP